MRITALLARKDTLYMPAKKVDTNHSNGHGSGRVKFRYADADRYVDFDMENVNSAVADGIKSLANALSGRHVSAPVRTLPAVRAASAIVTPVVDQEEIQFPPLQEEQPEQEDLSEVAAEEPEEANGTGSKRAYNFKAPTFMDELDLSKATEQLSDFMAEKGNPTETNDRYIAIAAWFKEHMNIEEFTIHHIYTAFVNLGWKAQVPVDHSQPLRSLKNKRHFLTKEKGGGYKVNFQGIQYVAKMGSH
jgi:hypothetical protein